jgi:hypothetical protein
MEAEIPMFLRILIAIACVLTVALMAASSRILPWLAGMATHRAKRKLADAATRLGSEVSQDVTAGPTEHLGTT